MTGSYCRDDEHDDSDDHHDDFIILTSDFYQLLSTGDSFTKWTQQGRGAGQ